MPRAFIVWVLILALLAAGCATNPHCHGGRFISEYKPGNTASAGWTPYQATYVLHHWRDRPSDPPPQTWLPENEVHEMYVRGLARWKRIGFEKNDKGDLFAVAGDEKILLQSGRYCWHISADTEYRGVMRVLNETGENVVYIVGLPFGVAAAAAALPFIVVIGGAALLVLPFAALAGS